MRAVFFAMFLTLSVLSLPKQSFARNELMSSYYDQFMFRVIGDCSDLNGLNFVSRGSLEAIPLGTDSAGRTLGAYFQLNLFEDGSYWARYAEFAQRKNEYQTTFSMPISGRWRVKKNELHLDGIGVATPSHASTGNTFTITIAHNFRAKIVGQKTEMTGILISQGPHGETPEQYCEKSLLD